MAKFKEAMAERVDVSKQWSPEAIEGGGLGGDDDGGKTPATLPVDDVDLDVAFSTCKRLAMGILRDNGADAQLLGPFITRLNGALKEELGELRAANKVASEGFCTALVVRIYIF